MTREVDVNSGAAPQPGGWAGADGAARGHALPGTNTEVEQVQELNEAPDVAEPRTVQEMVDREFRSIDVEYSSDADGEPKKVEAPVKKAAAKKTTAKS